MVLNQLKLLREELRNSANAYDNAFKNVTLIAAEELVKEEKKIKVDVNNNRLPLTTSSVDLDKQYFVDLYGSLKDAKAAYTKIHGKQKYGRSWSDFVAVARTLDVPKQQALTLEERITKIENFLVSLGYQL